MFLETVVSLFMKQCQHWSPRLLLVVDALVCQISSSTNMHVCIIDTLLSVTISQALTLLHLYDGKN